MARTADKSRLEEQVLEIVAELTAELQGPLAPSAVKLDQSLDRDLAIGSLERVVLLLRLERAFGVRLSDSAMMEAESAGDLVRAVLIATPTGDDRVPRAVGIAERRECRAGRVEDADRRTSLARGAELGPHAHLAWPRGRRRGGHHLSRALGASGRRLAGAVTHRAARSAPKGVLLTHDSLLANIRAIGQALGLTPGAMPFKLGAFKAAVEVQCPVIPVALRGPREVLPAGR